MQKKAEENAWIDITGFEGYYQITDDGLVRSIMKAKPVVLKQVFSKYYNAMTVQMTSPVTGRRIRMLVSHLVIETFEGKRPGMCVFHKNGDLMDNRLCNLAWRTQSQVSQQTGRYHRKPVAKVRYTGEIVENYPSATEAARKNGVCLHFVVDRCNGRIRDSLDSTGHTYMYLDNLFKLKGDSMTW